MKKQDQVKMIWSRVTKGASSPYSKMDESESTVKEVKAEKKVKNVQNMNQKARVPENNSSGKENDSKKTKKKRKGWKRFRHVALMTCRYIGIGVSHMSPMSTYPVSDYTIDPSGWYNTINKHCPYGSGVRSEPQYHWTTGILLGGW